MRKKKIKQNGAGTATEVFVELKRVLYNKSYGNLADFR